MSRDVVTVDYGTELEEAWQLMRRHGVQALPVIDRARRVIGIATRADFLHHAEQGRQGRWLQRLRHFLARTAHSHSDKHEVVGQIMTTPVRTVPHDAPVVSLVPLMAEDGFHHVPIVDAERRIAGMVTQTDLVAALYESNLARMMQPGAA
jgi:CBS domain-containing membrane protein